MFAESPEQLEKAKVARDIVLNLRYKRHTMSADEVSELWELIDHGVEDPECDRTECEVVPIGPVSVLKKYGYPEKRFFRYSQWLGVAGILVLAFASSVAVSLVYPENVPQVLPLLVVYEEHSTPPGVKSNLTLQDGSKVMLNSGSSIRYVKSFESDRRMLYLKGEAYFEVAKDTLRPFSVVADGIKTTALGTAFNVSAYSEEDVNVSLVEGKVAVDVKQGVSAEINLEKGEDLRFNTKTGEYKKGQFDSQLVLAWTKKTIIFQQVRMMEAIRILENWYGVKFILKNKPSKELLIYGRYEDEILENVLEGLSYTVRFDYKIDQDEVEIIFK
ncbi:FecR family protein [Algoriphagus jejuensis]|uniref:FecR family protein n=1 Tax=Algoriphagus jejuensis TaxID=419934 RepID=UPI0031D1A07D